MEDGYALQDGKKMMNGDIEMSARPDDPTITIECDDFDCIYNVVCEVMYRNLYLIKKRFCGYMKKMNTEPHLRMRFGRGAEANYVLCLSHDPKERRWWAKETKPKSTDVLIQHQTREELEFNYKQLRDALDKENV